MHGKGIYIWKDGRKYEGEYVNDKKHGFGSNVNFIKWQFIDGLMEEDMKENGKMENNMEREKYIFFYNYLSMC